MKQTASIQFTLGLLAMATYLQCGESLRCYSCDGPQECANPHQEQCPRNNECFTVAENYDAKENGLRKGCAPTCDRVNIVGMLCRTCRSELCNGKTGLGQAFETPSTFPAGSPFGPRGAAYQTRRTYVYSLFFICSIHYLQL